MSKIEVVEIEPTQKGGQAGDFITFAVDPGREDKWAEAALMSGWVVDAQSCGTGQIRVRTVRTLPNVPTNTEAVANGIRRMFEAITTNPDPKSRRTARTA